MTPQPIEPDPGLLLTVALDHASRGIPVFPCAPGAKTPITTHGLLDATTDPDRIRAWWRRTPTANLAIPTGSPGGKATFDVLDVDVRPGGSGFPALHILTRAGLIDGVQQVVATPGYGEHLYFPGSDQASGRIASQHLDFKANGGYILTPPSVVDGRAYEPLRETPGPVQALSWDAVRQLLTPDDLTFPQPSRTPRMTGDIHVLADWVARLPEGQRNTGTFWAACRAAEYGHTDLTPIVDSAVFAGLTRHEASRTVASAIRHSRQRPAQALEPTQRRGDLAPPRRPLRSPGR